MRKLPLENATALEGSAKTNALLPILVSGITAGTFDLTGAFISYGWESPRGIASGVLSPQALRGGIGVWIVGVILHFGIALSAAAIYYVASRRLTFLKMNFVVCGLF